MAEEHEKPLKCGFCNVSRKDGFAVQEIVVDEHVEKESGETVRIFAELRILAVKCANCGAVVGTVAKPPE